MRKIIQYMMMALIAVVLASCANDISEESTPTVKSNIRFVVDDFPMFEKPSTRTIGEEDKGKTAWVVGDEICVKLESKELGTQTATLKYNGVKFEIQDGNSLCYLEGEPVTAYAYYAPGRKYLNDGYLGYKDDGEDGIAEFIEATCNVHYGDDNYIDISFANVTRNYSRLRIATMPNKPITVSISEYTPAGSSNMIWDQNYALTSDEKGNAYLYGTFENNSEVTVKYREAALTTYTFSQATESAKSYALDATVISANSAEEIKSAIEQKVADGKTTIRLNLAPNAGTDEFMAIREAIKGAAPNDLGTIELTIIGVETIPEEAFYKMLQLKSVKMSDVKEIKKYAFKECKYLTVVEAPSLNKLCSGAFKKCDQLSKLTFGPINYADERNWPIFEYITPSIDLILSDYQKEMIETDDYLYTANNDRDYAGSYEHNSKNFLGREFKSITCRYRVE
ncbi:leucine-rich repeat domain-containing protein [Bacteroides xylanisolvens]|uniref:leucine-rich repeat protein n=2 Tax=Bacteroides xylanisolvens TaxID=371601 RepID=UPI001CDBF729|nr:leucine-rich repeat protein [Bacteroides xylanisolvens]MCA4571572.1 leucine-rich repeat domain-containing protein [Bacteroides xylanisolvens]MCA4611063.1 leucine-rich repeat domain-containing protein [Bacteroides xylanisolvens]MCA4653021.1 leucine-rich repeat domain-containing protein [Bacteroides xylanisolvens]MCA4667558.1 leucine-rich repeat domain-containing protein [Bacteroides xylanisolvens]MCA4672444.1 leucine-rich repeat domain-containing protein [Bacteroides xylanisolvens]